MEINRLLRPFKNRLFKEDLIRSLIGSLSTASVLTFILSAFYHFKIQEPDRKYLLLCFAGSFLAVFLFLFFIVFYPWRKRVARRLDSTGLKDRISTMIEYRDDPSPVAHVQRRNAQWYLRTMNPSRIRLNISRKRTAVAATCVLLMTAMLLTPYDIFARINPEIEARMALEKKIAALSDRLRTEITLAQFPESVETPLLGTVDTMQENMLAGANDLQRATSVILAKQEMENAVSEYVSRIKLGDAFQKYNATRSLGVSLAVGDSGMIGDTLTQTVTDLMEDAEKVFPLASDLRSALSSSGVDPSDALYSSFGSMASYLENNAGSLTEDGLTSLCDSVISAVSAQTEVEEKYSAIEKTLQEIQDNLLGFSRPEDPAEGVVNTDDGDVEEVDVGVDLRERDAFVGGGGRDFFKGMDEPMYDPELGVVTFGSVYEQYYEKYKEALKSGVIPEELKEMVDKYFYWLNNL